MALKYEEKARALNKKSAIVKTQIFNLFFQIQVTALLGHLNVNMKYFQWLGKKSNFLDFSKNDNCEQTEKDCLKQTTDPLSMDDKKKLELSSTEELTSLLKTKEADLDHLSREFNRQGNATQEAFMEAICMKADQIELTNQKLAKTNELIKKYG